jgi:hypothetical protein
MALHHEKLFLNVMCHSGDVSKQDDGGAARIGPSFPFRVKLRNTQHEQMSSAFSGNGHLARPIITPIKAAMRSAPLETGAFRSLAQSAKAVRFTSGAARTRREDQENSGVGSCLKARIC